MAAKALVRGVLGRLNGNLPIFCKSLRQNICKKGSRRLCYQATDPTGPEFGLFFDIDGVLVRGRTILPYSVEAFQLLTDKHGKFWVPTIFVTNAGNTLRQAKANQLSDWLGAEVRAEQVVMSHSPLKMFRQFLDKHVLVCGQGPVRDIARALGFTKVTTTETLRHCFPMLDMVDHKRRKAAPCAFEKYFPRIEAVIMFGEPVRWETNLQLLVDVLVTNGRPSEAPDEIPYPHLPVLACNMDLMWMAEACMPRFAHGCFLQCLESLYQKITGYELNYTALVGKPSEITYHYAEYLLQEEARLLGMPGIKRMYCIGVCQILWSSSMFSEARTHTGLSGPDNGPDRCVIVDNPDVDIYGANLYNRYLQKKLAKQTAMRHHKMAQKGSAVVDGFEPEDDVPLENGYTGELEHYGAESCDSVLVCTGVYSRNRDYNNQNKKLLLDHNHRDFIMDPELKIPTTTVQNVLEGVQTIFQKEGMLNW